MNGNALFRLAGPDIVHDVIDDGVVVVNLSVGAYFTLDGVAREIWDLLASGRSRGEITADLGNRYDGRPEEIVDGVESFLGHLAEEGLIVGAGEGRPTEPPRPLERTAKRPFAAPVLVKYTDLEDLLTLDPIHEVDDSGWPHVKAPTTS